MRPLLHVVTPAAAQRLAATTVCILTLALFAAEQPMAADDAPAGTPERATLAGWERVSGDVETGDVRVIYDLYVRPERNGLYTVTRYRITRKASRGAAAHDESEKYIWNVALGQPLRCFAREKGGWRALAHGTREYQAEMRTAMSVYALHRQATLAH